MAINIDISNYEEYLLSAVDGELNEEEQAALEVFLQQHPQYRQELLLLQSARIVPDEQLRFDNKEQLYRQTTLLSAGNYESYLLEYIDNELNEENKRQVEALAQQHPHIHQDLRLLQASRLEADMTVKYPDKASLYRNRSKVRPIWWWAAAAAVVAGVAVFTLPVQHKDTWTEVAVKETVKPATPVQSAPSATVPVDVAPAPEQQIPIAATQKDVPSSGHQIEKNTPATITHTPVAPAQRTVTHPGRQEENPASVALNKLPQPESTTSEIVQQLREQKDQNIANATISDETDKAPVVAKSDTKKEDAMNTRVSDASKPVQGELVVSVTMRGDSKILNGVANVARFLSKKKK